MARILVIEDDPPVRKLLCRQLAQAGHDVLDAADGATALGLVDLFDVDVVISDIMLREQNGVGALLTIRGSFPALPLIVISGGDRQDVLELLSSSGLRHGTWLLSKPFATGELFSAVNSALAT